MKYIFLDVDGVLNCETTKERCHGFTGIDPEKVAHLKYIVDQTGAQIILTSSWKYYWDTAGTAGMDYMGEYLNDALAAAGLTIVDKTDDMGENRGEGIMDFLMDHPAEAWVVLDDIFFADFEETGVNRHLVLTNDEEDGLTFELAIQAVHIMEEQLLDVER